MMEAIVHTWKRILLVACCLAAFAGCQSAATLSMAARSGDTVLVGLSGEAGEGITNTTHEVIRADDVSASITDSSGTTVSVKVREVFRVYADPTAYVLAADKGQWLAVVDLVNSADSPVPLSTGPATLNITSPKLIENMAVETRILAGTGSPHPLTGMENNFKKVPWLSPALQALVTVSGETGGASVGAVQYHFTVDKEPLETLSGALLSAIEGVKLVGRRDVSFMAWSEANPAGGTDLYVIMTAPDGVQKSQLKQFDMALVAGRLSREGDPTNYFAGSLQSALFYDMDGVLLGGLSATVGEVE
jgi:hypothetical protein